MLTLEDESVVFEDSMKICLAAYSKDGGANQEVCRYDRVSRSLFEADGMQRLGQR